MPPPLSAVLCAIVLLLTLITSDSRTKIPPPVLVPAVLPEIVLLVTRNPAWLATPPPVPDE